MQQLSLNSGDDHLTLRADGRLVELVCDGVALKGLEGSLWRLFYRRGELTQAQITANGQQASLERHGDGLRLCYDGLLGPDGPLDASLVIELWIAEGALCCEAELLNRDATALLVELQLPLIGDQGLARRALITTAGGGQRHENFTDYVRGRSRFGGAPYCDADHEGIQAQTLYPGMGAACNCFVSDGGTEGLYFGCHDPEFRATVHLMRLDGPGRDQPEAGFSRHLALPAGSSERFGRFVIAPYRGTWHRAADRYRAWADTWFKPRPVPAWVRRSHGWQRLILKHQNGEVLFRYDDLPRIHDDGAAAGLDTLFMFAWWPGGHDRGYPHYEPDPELGGEQALRDNIAAFQQRGGHVICYTSGRLIDRETPWYRAHGAATAVKRRSGMEVGDAYLFSNAATYDRMHGSAELTPACQSVPLWRQVLHDRVDQAADFGCHAIFYDQLGTQEHPCHDSAHGHPIPYFHQSVDKRALLDELQAHARARDPDMAMGIEILSDCTAQYADFVHGVYLQVDISSDDYRALGRRPKTTGFVEFWRYCFPEVVLSDRDIRDDEDVLRRSNLVVLRGLVSDAEIYRCRRTIATYPRYQEHLGSLNALRDHLAPWLVEGRYRDTCGFTCDGDIEARLFQAADGSVAVVTSQSHLPAVTVRIAVPGKHCTQVEGVGVFRAEPETGIIELEQDALAVLIFA
ncbi:MAG: DUF6259 domain-containing protein [Planctomycetota bacterium]|jgi:hypothetical protein|nr:DUF6259 domain-containing protein [Planctomycetota bacterium]